MGTRLFKLTALVAAVGLAGCATVPTASYVPVMPARYKPFGVFAQDQQACRAWASQQVYGAVEQTNNNALAGGLIGAALGAGLGAAASNGRGNAAAFGAATGAIMGSAVGAGSSGGSAGIQRRYDIAYAQCMYARGNQVPGMAAPDTPPPPPPPPGGSYAAPPSTSTPAYPPSAAPPPANGAPTTIYPRPPGYAPPQ